MLSRVEKCIELIEKNVLGGSGLTTCLGPDKQNVAPHFSKGSWCSFLRKRVRYSTDAMPIAELNFAALKRISEFVFDDFKACFCANKMLTILCRFNGLDFDTY